MTVYELNLTMRIKVKDLSHLQMLKDAILYIDMIKSEYLTINPLPSATNIDVDMSICKCCGKPVADDILLAYWRSCGNCFGGPPCKECGRCVGCCGDNRKGGEECTGKN